jgi:hypothetical protein
VSGFDFFPKEMPDLFTVDAVHPNDVGNYYMAVSLYNALHKALNK